MSGSSTNAHKSACSSISSIEKKYFPSLYQSADKAAIQMQRKCFVLRRWHLVLLILGSGGAALTTIVSKDSRTELLTGLNIGIAIILLIGFVINIVSYIRRYDEKWLNCRAIAESVKTATWRFMMNATPFEAGDPPEEIFRSKINEIQKHRQFVLSTLAPYQDSEVKLISDFMMNIRGKSTADRKNQYVKSRLLDQKTWYTKKSSDNSVAETHWFYGTTGLQFLAVVLAIIQAATTIPVNLVPILMTCAAASIAWSRMKKYGELAQSYFLAAQELGELESVSASVKQESEFCQFVNDVEYAISREHTMWCARRDVTVNPND